MASLMDMLKRIFRARANPRWFIFGLVGLFAIFLLLSIAGATSPQSGSFSASLVEMIINTIVVLGLLFLILAAIRRWQRHSGHVQRRNLAMVESLRLSPKQAIHIVRVGERHLLVGASDTQISLLAEVQTPPEMEQPASPPSFNSFLMQMRARFGPDQEAHSTIEQLESEGDGGLQREGFEV